MIIRDRPSGLRLLFTLRGSILPNIWRALAVTILIATLVTLADGHIFGVKLHIDVAVFGMLGMALAIFLGFRNNAGYDRYREGREMWGELILGARNTARQVVYLLERADLRGSTPERRVLLGLIALAHALRHELRRSEARSELKLWIDADRLDQVLARRSPTLAILDTISLDVQSLASSGRLSEYARVAIEQELSLVGRQIASCERLLTTPIPFAYTLLVHRTIVMYCLLLPFGLVDSCGPMTPLVSAVLAYTFYGLEALGSQIEEPFGLLPNDLPLHALCRVLETDLKEMLGEPPPEPLAPVDFVLS
jgi:ion channel-forming bestrophin family protein